MKTKLAGMGGAPAQLFVDDVFSTYLYTGNGSTQTITNGIDLAGKGGLVWIKKRNVVQQHNIYDSARAWDTGGELITNTTDAAQDLGSGYFSVSSTGFGLPTAGYNNNADTYASWTFRKAAKFFDVVTYTGTGSARTIAHSLGVAPGMIIVKCTSLNSTNWMVYSNGLTSAAYRMTLNSTSPQSSDPTVWNSTAPTSSVFSVGTDGAVNASGNTYVAYLYAHDTSSTGIIQCGSFTTNGSGNATVNLGWEPQYILSKCSSTTEGWIISDTMRGDSYGGTQRLFANTSAAEASTTPILIPTATGFVSQNGYCYPSATYIYMAICMPNKPPTTGTQVFSPQVYTGNATANRNVTTGFPVDMLWGKDRNQVQNIALFDRLRNLNELYTNLTIAEVSRVDKSRIYGFDTSNGILLGSNDQFNGASANDYFYGFKRAPGFFDEVCYTGTGVATTQAHNLTVVPEMMIVKSRGSSLFSWSVYNKDIGLQYALYLDNNFNAQYLGGGATMWNNTAPTSMVFSLGGTGYGINQSSDTYVAYLFATLAGISKVGSYTGNGSTGQAIACGFSAGARFVLIKRTDSTGDWYTFDSARGLTSGSSPYLLLNSTAAEVTGNNGVYASTGGFTLGATASTTTNINGASYIYLSVA